MVVKDDAVAPRSPERLDLGSGEAGAIISRVPVSFGSLSEWTKVSFILPP
jgi:hypothetical protein